MMKIISVGIETSKVKGRELFEYPEIEALLNEGWEIVDTLPPFGIATKYILTFILTREERKAVRKK